MFKKSKSEPVPVPAESPAAPAAPVAEIIEAVPAAEEARPAEDAKAETSEVKTTEPVAVEKTEEKKEGEPADGLMQIFMEDQEGLGSTTTIYEAFMESLTMEEVAVNARTLLADVKKRLGA